MKNVVSSIKASFRHLGALTGNEKGKTRRTVAAPRLLEENRLAWRIFDRIRDQLIFNPGGGVVAVRQDSWPFAFRVHQVPPYRETEIFEKLVFLGEFYVERVNDASNRKSAGRKADDEG